MVTGKPGYKIRTPGSLCSRCCYFFQQSTIFALKISPYSIIGSLGNGPFSSVPVGILRKANKARVKLFLFWDVALEDPTHFFLRLRLLMQPEFGLDEIWKDSIPKANKPHRGKTPWQATLSMKGISLTEMMSNKERNMQKSLKRTT